MQKLNSYLFHSLFFCLCLFSIFIIWQVPYFATGDGSCHVHNAMAWKDLLLYPTQNFYADYYVLNANISPNYFSHISLALLTYIFSPATSEKILVSFYILSLAFSFVYFLKQIACKNYSVVPLLFAFIFQVALFKGFYNYVLGISFYFLCLAYFIKHLPKMETKHFVLIFLASLLLFFVHVLAFALFLFSCLVFFIFQEKSFGRAFFIKGGKYLFVFAPSIILFFLFKGSQKTATWFSKISKQTLLTDLTEMSSITCLLDQETTISKYIFIIIFLMLLGVILYSIVVSKFPKHLQSLIVLLLFCTWIFFYLSDEALGGEMLKMRFQVFIFLFVLCIISLFETNKYLTSALLFTCTFLSFMLIYLKAVPIKKASAVVEDLMKAGAYIQTNSMLLPLSFHHEGVYKNELISQKVYLLQNHAANAIQQRRKIVFADNYEANTNYFPLCWKKEKNPFSFLGDLEGQPPIISIANYQLTIHYVLVFNLLATDYTSKAFLELQLQLDKDYSLLYENAERSILLYEIKGK